MSSPLCGYPDPPCPGDARGSRLPDGYLFYLGLVVGLFAGIVFGLALGWIR